MLHLHVYQNWADPYPGQGTELNGSKYISADHYRISRCQADIIVQENKIHQVFESKALDLID